MLGVAVMAAGYSVQAASPTQSATPSAGKSTAKSSTRSSAKPAPVSKSSARKASSTAAPTKKKTTKRKRRGVKNVARANAGDDMTLRSNSVLVVDQDSGELVALKNPDTVMPIASLTKLMTALVVLDAKLPLDEMLEIGDEDVDTERHTHSRLSVGTQLRRDEMLLLALMSSENRAASRRISRMT